MSTARKSQQVRDGLLQALDRRAAVRRTFLVVLVGVGFLAWILAIALEWPLVAWFAYATWAALAIGLMIQSFRRPRQVGRVTVAASEQLQNVYLGRRPPTIYPPDPTASSQYGDALPPDPLELHERHNH